MAKLLTFFDPTSPTSGNFVASFLTGCGTLHVKNASSVDVLFMLDNSPAYAYVVQAGEPRDIPVPKSKSKVFWSQQNKLVTNTKQIQSVVYVESYEKGEVIPVSQALPRHQNTTTIGFSVAVALAQAAAGIQVVSIANPANSGVNLTVSSVIVSAPSTNAIDFTPAFSVGTGAAPTLPNPLTPTNNLVGGPAAAAVCAFQTNFTGAPTVSTLAQVDLVTGVFQLLQTLQQCMLPPGTFGLYNGLQPSAGLSVTTSIVWTETPV